MGDLPRRLRPTRRGAILAPLIGCAAGLGFSGYAFAYEPTAVLDLARWRMSPAQWRDGPSLRIAVLTDLHFGEPFVSLERLEGIVASANATHPDLVCLLGDFEPGHRFVTREVPRADWARALAQLKAPLGVHAVLGNHDWWADPAAQMHQTDVPMAARALMDAGVPVHENGAIRLEKDGMPFWLASLGDQIAYRHDPGPGYHGRADLSAALAAITDDAPALMMVHEPDIFPRIPERIALTLAGHTHGGQVRLFGYSPMVPSRYGNRYAYGHVVERGRHLVVSGGIGPGKIPVRLGMPPEIALVEITAPA